MKFDYKGIEFELDDGLCNKFEPCKDTRKLRGPRPNRKVPSDVEAKIPPPTRERIRQAVEECAKGFKT